MMLTNAAHLRQTFGEAFYRAFRAAADHKLRDLIPRIPDLGDRVASMSFAFITAYVPFFHSFKQFDETRTQAGELLWVMNENLLIRFPSAVRTLLGRMATSKSMVESLRVAQLRAERWLLHPMDWRVVLEEPKEGGQRTTWTQCGALQALRAVGEDCVFPRFYMLDYLMANLTGLRFVRTKTLADGDHCCNNYIAAPRFTEWAPP